MPQVNHNAALTSCSGVTATLCINPFVQTWCVCVFVFSLFIFTFWE